MTGEPKQPGNRISRSCTRSGSYGRSNVRWRAEKTSTIVAQAHLIRERRKSKIGAGKKIVAQYKRFEEMEARLKAQEVTTKAQKQISKK